MAIRITLECGHASMLRVRTTPEGYTHDWEVFVRGVDGADISQYIEKVVFNLHETFPKPKRLFKDPPYIVKESGYAGFVIPITIYLKNKDEPKKIQILYDLTLQHGGPAINNVIRHSEIFLNPVDDFKRKLLKGGGIPVQNTEENHDKSESKTSVPMVGKPKLSGSEGKKSHRPIESRNEFADLFGVLPIKSTKVSPENKKPTIDKLNHHKISPDKIDKSGKSRYSPYKDNRKDKINDEKKDKKDKDYYKEKERSKEKMKRPLSPASKNNYQSPSTKRPLSPPQLSLPPTLLPPPPLLPPLLQQQQQQHQHQQQQPSSSTSSSSSSLSLSSVPIQKKQQLSPHNSINIQKSVSPKIREKEHKKLTSDREKDKDKIKENSKLSSDELKNDKRKRKHRDDKDYDRKDKNRDKERDRSKESKSIDNKKIIEKSDKYEKFDREKSLERKQLKDIKKSPKQSKEIDKQSTKIRTDKIEIINEKLKDNKNEKDRQRHKHRKKDKKEKRDESKDREKREKKDKQKIINTNKDIQQSTTSTTSTTTLSQPLNLLSTQVVDVPDHDTSDSQNSDDDEQQNDQKISIKNIDKDSSKISKTDSRLTRPLSPNLSSSQSKKDKNDKNKKDKIKLLKSEERENKKRKRRCDSKTDDDVPSKRHKDTRGFSPSLEPVSSSQSPITVERNAAYANNNIKENDEVESTINQNFETESEQIAPDSTNNMLIGPETDIPLALPVEYFKLLKNLQVKIMKLEENGELQDVVEIVAPTGQFELTPKTFDFDLCTLDRRTIQRLQEHFESS